LTKNALSVEVADFAKVEWFELVTLTIRNFRLQLEGLAAAKVWLAAIYSYKRSGHCDFETSPTVSP
jgi:hypothetical protein